EAAADLTVCKGCFPLEQGQVLMPRQVEDAAVIVLEGGVFCCHFTVRLTADLLQGTVLDLKFSAFTDQGWKQDPGRAFRFRGHILETAALLQDRPVGTGVTEQGQVPDDDGSV